MNSTLPLPSASWAYFLDFDGTLVDLAPTPGAVQMSPRANGVVRSLFERSGGALALVSGRSIADLDRIMGAPPLPTAGQHGLEWRHAREHASVAVSPAFREARTRLQALVERHPALLLEDKGLSLAVHYRQAPDLSAIARAAVERERAALGDAYRLQHGKCLIELRPNAGGKAHAVAVFLERQPFEGRVPVFIGDDETDEEAFVLVNDAGGMSIHVGPGERTAARWTMPSPSAVIDWLESTSPRRVHSAR